MFLVDLIEHSYWKSTLQYIKQENPSLVDISIDGKGVVILSTEEINQLRISDGLKIVTTVRLLKRQAATTYADYMQSAIS